MCPERLCFLFSSQFGFPQANRGSGHGTPVPHAPFGAAHFS